MNLERAGGTLPIALDWLAWPGIVIGGLLVLGSFEFVGSFEEHGWKLAATIVPLAYIGWSLWLIVTGVVLLAG